MNEKNPIFNNNFYISNNFQIENTDFSSAFKTKQSPPQAKASQFESEEIMKICNSQFQNILPNRMGTLSNVKVSQFPLERKQFLELLNQFELCIQLLFQNLLLSSNEETRARTYDLIMIFNNKKEAALANIKLPTFEVSLATFTTPIIRPPKQKVKVEEIPPKISEISSMYYYASPQISIYQVPLLEFSSLFLEIMSRNHLKNSVIEILMHFVPLLKDEWLPIFDFSKKKIANRSKFTGLDDQLLRIGIIQYGAKNFDLIQRFLIKDKTSREIKNRYKNLICSRAEDNPIKLWKLMQFAQLEPEEQMRFQKGYKWFGGQKLPLIQKYFLPNRTIEFLDQELKRDPNLLQKRRKLSKLGLFEDQPEKRIHLEPSNNLKSESKEDEDSFPLEWLNYDKESLSDEEDDGEMFFDKDHQKMYRYIDGATFECEEL